MGETLTTAIDPEKVLGDLRDLWAKLGSEQKGSGGVLRACTMTLIAVVEDGAASEAVRKVLGAVMHNHPCRAIVLRRSPGVESRARVFSECWIPRGGQSQICAEGIELTADASQPGSATQLILPLLVTDLPVVLWVHGSFGSGLGGSGLGKDDELLRLAHKVIVDSGSFHGSAPGDDAMAGIAMVRALGALPSPGGRHIADLAWTRLTTWREGVSNAFACKKRASGVSRVRVEFGGQPSSSVLYFKRWIERALPSATVTIESGSGVVGLHAVTLEGARPEDEVSLRLAGKGAIEVQAGDCSARSPLPPAEDDALMCEELSILGADPVFMAVLESLRVS